MMRLKHLFHRLLAMVLALAIIPLSLAMAAAPGETVYIPIPYYINGIIELNQVQVTFSLTDGLSFNGANGGVHQVRLSVSPPSPQGVVYLPVTVNANAPGMGDQMVDISQVVGGYDGGLDTAGNPATHTIQVTEHVHSFDPWQVVTVPTWTDTGLEQQMCTLDNSHIETRVIPPLADSQFGPWITVKAATYEETGLEERIWTYQSILKETREIPKKEIIWGEWKVVTPATYETKGLERRVNTLDEAKFEEREVPIKQTIWGDWEIITPATYENKGLERRVNTLDEAKFEEREIPKKQIIWGEWKVVTPATYEQTGLERRANTLDEAKFEEREIPKKEIIWGEWQVVRQATCTQEGLAERMALGDASQKETRALPMLPHQETAAWIVTKLPTFEAEGLKILQCKVGGETLRTMAIPAQTVPAWTRSPLDAAGPGGRKGPVSINLEKEGSKVIRLVDQAGTIMGKLMVMVQNSQVTFNYEIFPPFTATGGNVSLSDPQRGAMILPFNKPFSIARDLGGQTRFDVYVSLEAQNPEALAKLTSPSPLVMPNVPMQTIDISAAMGSASMTTGSGSDVNNMNMDELMALLPLIEKTAEGQNDAAAQAMVQDMMAKAQNLLTQADSMSEAARKRSIDALLSAAIQMKASIPQITGTGSEQLNKAGQDANTPAWNNKDLMQAQINLEEEGTQDSYVKIDETIKDIIKNLSDLTNTLRVWEKTFK